MRVYQLAKELDIGSKDFVTLIGKMGIVVKGHMSGLEDSDVARIRKEVSASKNPVKKQDEKKVSTETSKEIPKEIPKEKLPVKPAAKIEKAKVIEKPVVAEVVKEVAPEVVPEKVEAVVAETTDVKEIEVKFPVTVGNLAKALNVKANELIKKLMERKIFASINQEITRELVEDVLLDYDCLIKEAVVSDEVLEVEESSIFTEGDNESLKDDEPRAPIVTMMGHVDHGKTSLLDRIRSGNVADGEAGGITQHIGAYKVKSSNGEVVFVDTPGHEAFTAMRARGANVTDIVVLVIAADDGIMPQTKEAIDHAKAAGVPIIVAINKIDKPEANSQNVKTQLTEFELVSEEWGGSTICVDVSAHTGQGIDDLIEAIFLEAEMLELKTCSKRRARGVVVEAHLDKGRGPVTTVIVMAGTLKIGQILVAETHYGKIRALVTDCGKRIKKAGPATPVEVWGLNGVPTAGDKFVIVDSEREARQYHNEAAAKAKEIANGPVKKLLSLEDLYSQISEGNLKELNIVLKADNTGSLEALRQSLLKLSNEQVGLKILHEAVGPISESDVVLAKASGAIVIAFHVKVDPKAFAASEREGVDIRSYKIIYEVIDEVRNAMEGVLDALDVEVEIGEVEVRAIFKSSKVGTIAGSYVRQGKVVRNSIVRVMRGKEMIYDGHLETLKREKDDVREVLEGYECGIVLAKYNDLKEGDILKISVMEKQKQLMR